MVEKIGPYEIVKILGEGGMGVVYLADQQDPIRRRVAVKLIRKTHADGMLLARFEAERRALARLNHPNVAQVFDSGTAADGSPFIVMEHVDGEDITRFCDRRQATIGARLEVFIDVCKGVQHVHQKGLIHRDLKPANILVSDTHGTWAPKIIDFGIAKGFRNPLTEETLTKGGGILGTPMYVAPEVLKEEEHDTRVDVYALGMVLYRLLIGVKPVPPSSAGNLLEMMRSLSRGEAVPPLTKRYRQLNATQRDQVGRERQIQPRALERLFARDLDWVVMRAIHADPDRRYETPVALASDLERYLAGEPVKARPPSLTYVGLKALRRNRWAAAGAAVLFGSMVLGTASTMHQASKVRQQAERARDAAANAKEAAGVADEKRLEAEQVSRLMGEMFANVNPYKGMGGEPTVQDLLDRATEALKTEDIPPLVRAKLLGNIGIAYQGLSRYELAISHIEDAFVILEAHPDQQVEAATLQAQIAGLEANLLRDEEALARAGRALARFDEIDAPEHARFVAYHVSGTVHLRRGDVASAKVNMARALEAVRAGPSYPADEVSCLEGLAKIAARTHDFDAASAYLDQALDILERDTRNPAVISVMQSLAQVQAGKGDPELAMATIREALALAESHLGPNHPATANVRLNVAFTALHVGLIDEAKEVFRGFVQMRDEIPRGLYTSAALGLADALMKQQDFARSEALLREVLEDETLAASRAMEAQYTLAQVIASQGRRVEAERAYRFAIKAMADFFGPTHPRTMIYVLGTGYNWFEDDNPAEAEHWFRVALAAWEDLNPEQQQMLLTAMISLLEQTDRAEEAGELEARLTALED